MMKIIILMARAAAMATCGATTNHEDFKGGGQFITKRARRDSLDPDFVRSASCIAAAISCSALGRRPVLV